jgi:predicted nucleotidyltransferase component of viral defense system
MEGRPRLPHDERDAAVFGVANVTKDGPRNLPASVRERLRKLAAARKEDFQLVLTRYGLERLLYRLSRSPHAELFILKGAMLFQLWTDQPHRPTRDLDLLGRGGNSIAEVVAAFRDVCNQAVEEDGLEFAAESVHGERIREDQEYEGIRVHCQARLENARIPLQVDVGFGDAVTPAATGVRYPTLLDFPAPTLRAYRRETVIAEKFQAMIFLGIANSRMKDFYDLWVLARDFAFDGSPLSRAIQATFRRRQTALPAAAPLALTAEFAADAVKRKQWQAFLSKSKLDEGAGLAEVVVVLHDFLMPPVQALAAREPFERKWPAGGPWSATVKGSRASK